MRAYPYVHVSLAIVVLIAASLAATLVCPQDAMAREPEYEIVTDQRSGGTSGGGEWRTPPEEPPQLPLDLDERIGGGGKTYSEPRSNAGGDSWVEAMNSMVVRMVRFVGTTFSELF
jgi:hypothetical protein